MLKAVQSDKFTVIQKYLEDDLLLLRNKTDQLTSQLTAQSLSCPPTLHALDMIDERLREFVRLHHIDLMRTVRYRVTKLKDETREKVLFKQLSYYYLDTAQVTAENQTDFTLSCHFYCVSSTQSLD